MSTQEADNDDARGLPTREEVLSRGTPFLRVNEMRIDGLSDEEEDTFLRAIAEA